MSAVEITFLYDGLVAPPGRRFSQSRAGRGSVRDRTEDVKPKKMLRVKGREPPVTTKLHVALLYTLNAARA